MIPSLVRFCINLSVAAFCSFSLAVSERNFPLVPGVDLIGENQTVSTRASDTLVDISAKYRVGYNLVRSANPDVDAWLPGEGTEVMLPLQTILPNERTGIVINTPEMRLYFYKPDKGKGTSVTIYSVSVGRGEWSTPITRTRVTGRVKDPSWYPPETIRAEHAARGDYLPKHVKPGANNPLGEYLLMLGIPSYFIHGTNKRYGIGMQVTHGCIRMFGADIELLFKEASNNTPVVILNQPFKVGWGENKLYLEVHPPLELAGAIPEIDRDAVLDTLKKELEKRPETLVNWQMVDKAISEQKGVPEPIGTAPKSLSDFSF